MSQGWLPSLVLFTDAGGDWKPYLERLYAHFVADFEQTKPVWPGKRMGLKRLPEHDGKSATFWHFISEGPEEAERYPDFRRCERIRWPRPIIDAYREIQPNPLNDRIVWWKNKRGREQRYLLALPNFSYVLVMADRGSFVLPWTAYPVEREHQRRKLVQEYHEYWLSQKG